MLVVAAVSNSFLTMPPLPAKFLNLIHHAAQGPRKKYPETQTESQEIGWDPVPLVSMAPSLSDNWEDASSASDGEAVSPGFEFWVTFPSCVTLDKSLSCFVFTLVPHSFNTPTHLSGSPC